jgi:Fibronectin type III domain
VCRARAGLVCAALVAAPLVVLHPSYASSPTRPQTVTLDEPVHGRKAVRQLGEDLDVAAAANGLAEDELRDLLLGDDTAWVDGNGRVFYVEPTADIDDAGVLPPYPAVDSFALHSKPGSQRVLFLDFDGHVVQGTAWNTMDGVAAGAHPAWTLDGDAATFSTTERNAIASIWARVAEDYAPFDVDVTTADPGQAAINRTDGSDQTYGTRVLISPSSNASAAICGGGCGGVAYLDVFDASGGHDYFQPAWVFPQSLGQSTKAIAEAASHEAGHNLGLDHDPTSGSSYYGGHAMWAPIMGVGYARPVVQWSKGDYPNGSNKEDDLAIIADSGAPYRADEAGGTVGSATALSPGTAYVTSRTDVDVWAIGTCSGAVTLAADPAPTSPNLDIELTLLSEGGATVATANPVSAASTGDVATGMAASIATSLTTGAYFLQVDGVGNGTPTTGYDDYASIGAYTLSTTGCDTGGVDPVVPGQPTDLSVTPAGNGQSATFAWSAPFGDGGSPLTGYVVQRSGEGSRSLAPSVTSASFGGLTPGASYTFSVRAHNAVGPGPSASVSLTLPTAPPPPAATAPSAPRIGTATPGKRGGRSTLTIAWSAPASTGGAAINAYVVRAYRIRHGTVVATVTSSALSATRRSLKMRLPKGRYKLAVMARNSQGYSPLSARSPIVKAR